MLSQPQAEFTDRLQCINCGSTDLTDLSRGKFTDQPLVGFLEADPWGESPLPYLQDSEWILTQCRGCKQVFHKRVLTKEWDERRFSLWVNAEAIRKFEERRARTTPDSVQKFEAGRQRTTHILRLEKLTRSIRKRDEPVRILDFGCGWGDFVIACNQFGFQACGVDRATPRIEGAAVPIFSSLDDLGRRPRFHAATLFQVLEHLDEPASILKQIADVLVPDGVLVLETPDCRGVTGIRNYFDYRRVHPLSHVNAFTHDTLKSIAERQGFLSISRGSAHVTSSVLRVVKTQAKHLLARDGLSTQLYFRKKN